MTNKPNHTVYEAILGDANQKTAEVSLGELRQILAESSALIVDTRKQSEFLAGHIPGAHCIPSNHEWSAAESIAPVERLAKGDKSKRLVLYCNGPFCKGTRRLSGQLFDAGFTNVRRFQLGIPIWRALGGPTEIELDGITRIYNVDRTAVFFDARPPEEFARGSIAGAHNVPVDATAAGFDSLPLPRNDFNTRIILFGSGAGEARALAEILGESPFHNITYYAGAFETLSAAAALSISIFPQH